MFPDKKVIDPVVPHTVCRLGMRCDENVVGQVNGRAVYKKEWLCARLDFSQRGLLSEARTMPTFT